MKNKRIEIAIVDHRPLLRDKIRSIIEGCDLFDLVGVVDSSKEISELLKKKHADIMLLAPEGSVTQCIQTLLRILKQERALKVILTNVDMDLSALKTLARASIRAFILELSEEKQYLEIILEVHRHGRWYHNELKDALADDGLFSSGIEKSIKLSFTEREYEIAILLCKEHSVKEIAVLLSISTDTVNTHVAHLQESKGKKQGGAC